MGLALFDLMNFISKKYPKYAHKRIDYAKKPQWDADVLKIKFFVFR